jgi:phosphatidylinositol alpha-1,6-mannosyltransferase
VGSYCQGFAYALHQTGVDIQVVAARKTSDDDAYDRQLPYRVRRTHQKWQGIRHLSRLAQTIKALREMPEAVIWAAEWRSGVIAAFASKICNKKLIITIHGTELLELESSLIKRAFARPVYKQACKIIAISGYVRDLIAQKLPCAINKTVVIKNGINAAHYAERNEQKIRLLKKLYKLDDRKIILSLCRLVPRKGVDTSIRAFAELIKTDSHAVLIVAGTGPDEMRLKKLVEELRLQEHVFFVGYVPDDEIKCWYQLSDIYIMMSRKDDFYVEGFGLTFLEANACGIPVVGGNHGGVSDAIMDGITGYLVEPLDAQTAAEKMRALLADRGLYESFSKAGEAYVDAEGSWARAADEFVEMLNGSGRLD